MTDVPDDRLLEQFARNGSEQAFAALVQRHLGFVHSVALRHTANPQQSGFYRSGRRSDWCAIVWKVLSDFFKVVDILVDAGNGRS